MSDFLDNLSKEEYLILDQIKVFKDEMEIIEYELKLKGIPELYESIYERYLIYFQETDDLEAFKRAIFIQWYAATEPTAFTGIGNLNSGMQASCLTLLGLMIKKGAIDKEFEYMISHYYTLSDWYFDEFIQISRKMLIVGYIQLEFESSFECRGQMGLYWKSYLKR